MKYLLLAAAIATLALTACGEPRRTPDGHLMDKPVPSAYAPSDFEDFDADSHNED
ncbi:MAG: hypothetical protein OEX11_08465 [Nitrosomonas sp.]|nr:hypothetical protein [Nitrosomonas sp.]